MGFGSCIVSIFPCPVPALGLGGPYSLSLRGPNPNLMPFDGLLDLAGSVVGLLTTRVTCLGPQPK
ncbi:uncharacterized protein B0H18DRAFT_971536 [Fomitopsis serialis]|uniref:uncharacterized protein n=1 Tax=Fomitopsis serialis TaxID=139415 RepID=UPI00200734D0|nr:uncharacterized protein B0H18DRAFT_971536 [Neoantrodia serialis]KAH9937637.1 hypothetical protein B0H18DRAFT_971536 [Neoantrodia serialis]